MPDQSAPLLQIQDLRVVFGTPERPVVAVNGIDLTIQPGETVALVGESGSGKSVTALSILRLVHPAGALRGGQIYWREPGNERVDLLQLPEEHLRRYRGRRISMIFQEPMTSLNPVFTCGEQVAESLRLHLELSQPEARRRTLEWFERVQLPEAGRIYAAFPHQLSGGQRQRVMIAMALCTEPALLIADEPTTALDVTIQQAVLELIRELSRAQGTAVLFISHDLGVVYYMAGQVLIMRHGQVVEQGPRDAIFFSPRAPYTKGLLAARPRLGPQPRRLPTVEDFTDAIPPPPQTDTPVPSVAPVSAAEPLLSVRQLHTRFAVGRNWLGRAASYVDAVQDVSFDLWAGRTVGLVGESGCGKTTLGRSLLRLVEPAAGEVLYQGQDLLQLPERELRRLRPQLQMVFQDPYASLNPRLPIGETLTEPLRVHGIGRTAGERRDLVVALLERVGLEADHYDRLPRAFSGGQRQRIGIARALILRPRVLICDEAVSALDVSVQAQILNLLKDLQEAEGFALLFISHDLGVVQFISDHILVMHRGRIVEAGSPTEIYERPREAYTRRLLAAVPEVPDSEEGRTRGREDRGKGGQGEGGKGDNQIVH